MFGDSALQFAHIWRGCPAALIGARAALARAESTPGVQVHVGKHARAACLGHAQSSSRAALCGMPHFTQVDYRFSLSPGNFPSSLSPTPEPGVLDSVYAHLRPPPKTAPGVNDMFNAWDKAFPPVSPEAIECVSRPLPTMTTICSAPVATRAPLAYHTL